MTIKHIRGDAVGNICTTFQGNDTGTLSFGNCPTGGKIKAFLDDKAIAEATALHRKQFFGYSIGDVLKIGEHSTAIRKLYPFLVKCK